MRTSGLARSLFHISSPSIVSVVPPNAGLPTHSSMSPTAFAELRPELAEHRVVRHHDQPRLVVEDARGLEQTGHDHVPRGVGGGLLLDQQPARERLAQLGRQVRGRVLEHGAKRVQPAVRALQGEGPRLSVSQRGGRRQATSVGAQVEERQLHGRRVEVAIVGAPEPSVQGALLVPGPDHHGPDRRRHADRRGVRLAGRDRAHAAARSQEHQQGTGPVSCHAIPASRAAPPPMLGTTRARRLAAEGRPTRCQCAASRGDASRPAPRSSRIRYERASRDRAHRITPPARGGWERSRPGLPAG